MPIYDATLTQRAKDLYGEKIDSVFQKRYFSTRSQGNNTLYSDAGSDPKNNPTGNVIFKGSDLPLPFDPGWNTYQSDSKTTKEQDMAVIFSPSDKKMMEYFFDGGGKSLIESYAPEYIDQITPQTTDFDLVYHALDKIPRSVIQALLNNLMKESFNNSVPSKFETIKNSAQDAMFNKNDDYHRGRIDTVLLANNGLIYVMDEVTSPAEYAAVLAPAYIETDKQIFKYAIQAPTLGGADINNGIPTNYNRYLLAMSSRFSFFVPSDDFWYIDPLSFYSPSRDGNLLVGRAFNYTWDEKTSAPKATAYNYKYDPTTKTGTIDQAGPTASVTHAVLTNRLKDMLETHTIIHEDKSSVTGIDETKTGVECAQHYFVAKNGTVIYVEDAEKRANEGDPMTLKGGWQLSGNDGTVSVTKWADQSEETNGYGNGFAYTITAPIQPTIESVFSALHNNPNFQMFYELCQTDAEVLQEIGITTNSEKLKHNIFENNGGLPCYDATTGNKISDATNVRFFNNYRYTIYVPTNEAIQDAIDHGLPTWQDLRDLLELDIDVELRKELTKEEEDARNLKIKAMATSIVNFVKFHFQDNSIFADTPAMAETAYETATMNSETQTYYKLTVSSAGGGTLTVRDLAGHTRHITSDKNIIVRDYITAKTNTVDRNTITSSSSAVIHGIDGVLNYKTYADGLYSSDLSSLSKARAYLNKYRLIK